MKKIYFTIVVLLMTWIANGQTKGQDWTRNDCDGNPHALFNEIDSGYVIVLEYVMIPTCQYCITAAHTMEATIARQKATHNNKLLYYTLGYNNAYTCAQMKSWASTNNILAMSVFDKGSSDVSYYGGMGMPTIVILGKGHRITYKKLGFAASDTTAINTAIENAFSWPVGINDPKVPEPTISVAPNPARSDVKLDINLVSGQDVSVSIYDVFGKEVLQLGFDGLATGAHSLSIPIDRAKIDSGLYFIRTNIGGNSIPVKLYITN